MLSKRCGIQEGSSQRFLDENSCFLMDEFEPYNQVTQRVVDIFSVNCHWLVPEEIV